MRRPTKAGAHGPKRSGSESLGSAQDGNRAWWESTPMTYDWRRDAELEPGTIAWFDDQDARSGRAHAGFAGEAGPLGGLIPFDTLDGADVLEIGVGSGYHAELLSRAGARVTGIDLTTAAVDLTRRRFELKGLDGAFEAWDAERERDDFVGRFDLVWSWGVVHHTARTARVVRNVASWLKQDGRFAGMVYHRNSTSAAIAVLRDGVLKGRLRTLSVDEILWRNADGYSARHYTTDQWRDLLLGFFDEATVRIGWNDADVVPLPHRLRRPVVSLLSNARRRRVGERRGSLLLFEARSPIR